MVFGNSNCNANRADSAWHRTEGSPEASTIGQAGFDVLSHTQSVDLGGGSPG